jgi:hypothetical protein
VIAGTGTFTWNQADATSFSIVFELLAAIPLPNSLAMMGAGI